MQPLQRHLENEFRPDSSVIERRVTPGQEYPLIGQVASLQVFFHEAVAAQQPVPVFDQWDDADALGSELSHPITDRAPAGQRLRLLPHDDLPVVRLHESQFLCARCERQDDLLYRRNILVHVCVEAAGHVPRRRHALQRLHHGLAHVALDRGIGHAQRQHHVASKAALVLEEVRVARQQFLDDVVVRLLALRVPHLLVAAEGKDIRGLVHLAFALQHALGVREWRWSSVVRVLGAHDLWHKSHRKPRIRSWQTILVARCGTAVSEIIRKARAWRQRTGFLAYGGAAYLGREERLPMDLVWKQSCRCGQGWDH